MLSQEIQTKIDTYYPDISFRIYNTDEYYIKDKCPVCDSLLGKKCSQVKILGKRNPPRKDNYDIRIAKVFVCNETCATFMIMQILKYE